MSFQPLSMVTPIIKLSFRSFRAAGWREPGFV